MTTIPTLGSIQNIAGDIAKNSGGAAFDAITSGKKKPSLGNDKTNPPRLLNANDTKPKGLPTLAPLASGNVVDTTIDNMNNSLAHACDFVIDLKKNIGLKKFIRAIASGIRTAIRSIMRLLGITDITGNFHWLISKMQAIVKFIQYVQREWIQPILDFQKYVIAVLVKIREVVSFILSLPEKIIALLKDCLSKLYDSLSSIFKDALAEAAAEVPLGTGGSSGFTDLISAGKETAASLQSLGSSLKNVVVGGLNIVGSSTIGLLTPVSTAEITAANATITNYGKDIVKPQATPTYTKPTSKGTP